MMRTFVAIGLAILVTAVPVLAQDEPPLPPAAPAGAQPLSADVIELTGTAYMAPGGADLLDQAAWKKLAVGDKVPPGSQLRTANRTRLLLQIGDDTLMLAEPMTRCSLDELYTTPDTKTTRLSLGHGTIRAGVAEGELRSDLTIDSTVATLSKRGTWGFEMTKFGSDVRMSLAERGLVEAIYKLTNQRRLVNPGQYVNARTIARLWITQSRFDRAFSLFDAAGRTGAEVQFASLNDTGMAVVNPGGGVETYSQSGRAVDPTTGQVVEDDAAGEAAALLMERGLFLNRPEGNFGFGGMGGMQDAFKRLRGAMNRGGDGAFSGKVGDRRIRPIGGKH